MASEQTEVEVVAEVLKVRTEIGHAFSQGRGVEVGPGDRPFPIPPTARISYSDIWKHEALENYFRTTHVTPVQHIASV